MTDDGIDMTNGKLIHWKHPYNTDAKSDCMTFAVACALGSDLSEVREKIKNHIKENRPRYRGGGIRHNEIDPILIKFGFEPLTMKQQIENNLTYFRDICRYSYKHQETFIFFTHSHATAIKNGFYYERGPKLRGPRRYNKMMSLYILPK